MADVAAPRLFCEMLPEDAIPAGMRRELQHYVWDPPAVKVNYALNGPIPWRSESLRSVGTVHLGADGYGLVRWMADLNTRVVPEHPFMLLGQTTTADPSRSPAGTESVWAYTHLPRNVADDASAERLATSVDHVIEEHAPGFGSRVIHRYVQRPSDLEASDANLRLGALNGGTAQLQQMLIFRPPPAWGEPKPRPKHSIWAVRRLLPAVRHGACGRNAARAALAVAGVTGWPHRKLSRALTSL